MTIALKKAFNCLDADITELPLAPRNIISLSGEWQTIPSATALQIRKYPSAPIQIFFGGHMDTVHALSSPFQTAKIHSDTLFGPGAADMKGGLVILLHTLQALELTPYRGTIGWEVLINPDEEIGSPSSHLLFKSIAQRNHLGLIFEPSFSDGALVDKRKGSANFTIVSKGRLAHAGRDFFEGRNAIVPLANFALAASELTQEEQGVTVNVGSIRGGGSANVVPDLAFCKLNVRAWTLDQFDKVKSEMASIIHDINRHHGGVLSLHEDTTAPPKPYDEQIKSLYNLLHMAAAEINLKIQTRSSGGVCDGSRLYAEGLPNIDTMGIVGGGLHTEEEYAFLPSLVQRTQLATLFVLIFANHNKQVML